MLSALNVKFCQIMSIYVKKCQKKYQPVPFSKAESRKQLKIQRTNLRKKKQFAFTRLNFPLKAKANCLFFPFFYIILQIFTISYRFLHLETQPAKDSNSKIEKHLKTQRTGLAQKPVNNYLSQTFRSKETQWNGNKRISTGNNGKKHKSTGKNAACRQIKPQNKEAT